jgi:hypothetical protein
MNHRRVLQALLVCAAVASVGCARKFVVVSAAPPARGSLAPAEVLETDDYEPNRAALKSVAVRFPNDCWKFEKRSDGSGQVSATLTPTCAPWGEALTRSLADAGFKVTGLQDFLMLEAKQRMSPPAAAKWLGVNALLVIDKVEAGTAPLEEARRAKLVVTQADPDGTVHEPATLDEKGRKGIEELVADRVRPWGPQAVEAVAEIKVTAVLPGTGAPLWRYARRATAPEAAPAEFKMLLRGRGGRWIPVQPVGVEKPAEPIVDPRVAEMFASKSANPFAMPTQPKVPEAKPAVNLPALVRELTAELADRLANGT